MMVKEGYKESALGVIPKDWKIKQLNEIGDITGGNTPRRSKEEYWGGNIPWLTPSQLTGKQINEISVTDEYITEKGFENSSVKLLPPGTVMLTSRATIGETVINKVPMTTNQGFANIKCDSNKMYNYFLLYLLRYLTPRLEALAGGSTFLEISRTSVRSLNIPIPPLKEQKKIAAILSSVDETIEKTDQVIEKTKELKKGLMQQLLTKGIGHDEFKEVLIGVKKFNIPVNWKLKSINFFANDFISGGTPSTDESEYWNGDIDFITGAYIKNRVITQGKDKISKEGLNNSSSNLIPKNNVIICTRTAVGNIGKNLIDIAISQDVTGIILNKEIIDVDYFVWSVIRFKYLLKIYQQGSTIKGITRNVLKSFKLPLPPLEEQKKIAKILSTVEEKVQKEEEYKAKLERLKKGLMQKLLTGEIRVNVDDIKEA